MELSPRNFQLCSFLCLFMLPERFEGQGHSMTLQQNCVRPITFVIWSRISQLFHRNDNHIVTICRAQKGGYFFILYSVCDITLTQEEVYLPVTKTNWGSITWFNQLLFFIVKSVRNLRIIVNILKKTVTALAANTVSLQ
jgi:hypothetical protein